jgi:trehalose 6-phosphate phosphatase
MNALEIRASESGHAHPGHPNPATIAVLLDVDGTLIEIAPTPQEVRVPASLKHVLGTLRNRMGGALALVSGRPLADIDRLFAPLRVAAVGGHGAENRLTADGEIDRSRVRPFDPELRRRLLAIAAATPGVLAEDKGYSIALHYRLAPDQEQRIRHEINLVCSDLLDLKLEVLPGKSMFEVKPRTFNKGVAVRQLMKHPPFRGRRPIFFGDDVTDESVFKVMPEFDGLAFSVGKRFPGTSGYFATPREVRHWLYGFIGPLRPGDDARLPTAGQT